MEAKTYEDGVKEGRKQIIKNIKKHYDEMYFHPPDNVSGISTGVCIPDPTLIKYFGEIARA
ncbi:hypothetical protein LCGC14_1267620 [marine sediment metagenome]|uniref:Uncharacterized protein n=1 Tax=marine sediment metagenome TaxID=412755 RepID=A0A0F9P277_9ZZZZ